MECKKVRELCLQGAHFRRGKHSSRSLDKLTVRRVKAQLRNCGIVYVFPSRNSATVNLQILALPHEVNKQVNTRKILQFHVQPLPIADTHVARWCHESQSSKYSDSNAGLPSISWVYLIQLPHELSVRTRTVCSPSELWNFFMQRDLCICWWPSKRSKYIRN